MALVGDKPGRLVGWLLRLPTFCYRCNLGWIFGHRFLMLTHRGRRSGRLYHTVLEVLRFDPATQESIVAAAWGDRADWLRNIRASPAVEIRTGCLRYAPTQHILTDDEARAVYRLEPAAPDRGAPLPARVGDQRERCRRGSPAAPGARALRRLSPGSGQVGIGMNRVLLTGMSGTGKSTLICEFAARGYKAIDTDTDEWSEWVTSVSDLDQAGTVEEPDWVWREDRMQLLLATEDSDVLFVSGCKSNQGKFYPQFDHIILLSAPVPLLIERLATRATNPYGKHPDELAQVLQYVRSVEPLLRRTASLEVDTSAPIEQIIETILSFVLP